VLASIFGVIQEQFFPLSGVKNHKIWFMSRKPAKALVKSNSGLKL
jgi:hypothetical protein